MGEIKAIGVSMTPASNFRPADFPPEHSSSHDAITLDAHLARLFDLRAHHDEAREDIEDFIRNCFEAAYGARISQFMPRLFSLHSKRGDLIAAFGLRAASASPLFLETYLDQPIEVVLHSRTGLAIQRKDVIEVGNLSALYPGAARWLIVALTAMLHNEGFQWVTFTGTSELRNGFSRLGLTPMELGAASMDRLPLTERCDWGSYYDHAPMVMAGNIAQGYHSLLQARDLAELMRASVEGIARP